MNGPTYFNPQPKGGQPCKPAQVKIKKANTINLSDFKGLVKPGLLESRVEELERQVAILLARVSIVSNSVSMLAANKSDVSNSVSKVEVVSKVVSKPVSTQPANKETRKEYMRDLMRRKRAEGVKELIEKESMGGKVVGHFV